MEWEKGDGAGHKCNTDDGCLMSAKATFSPAVVAGSRTILRFVNLMEGGRMHEYS